MTPQERQMVDDLFDRLGKVETAPRDPDASAAIADGLRKAPNAVYALVQTVLVQDEALKRANAHIQELEAAQTAQAPHQQQPAGFLDSMRETLFGPSGQPHGSVPSVPPPQSHPVWNSGQVMNQTQPPGYAPPPYGQPAYSPSSGGSMFGGGGSFLGTAAAAAAGMVGGSLMLNSIRSMMGGPHYGLGNPAAIGGVAGTPGASPWSDQSNSDLARNAGINDIGSAPTDSSDSSRAGLLDQASDDQSNDQNDQTSNDDDDGGNDMNADDNNFDDDDGDSGNDDGGTDFA